MLPDWESLRLLVDVDRLGSIGAAARASGTSQQAASTRLRVMETDLGLELLLRDSSGSRTTPAGTLLVGWAGDLLDRADHLERSLLALREQTSAALVVYASLTVAETLLPSVLVRLREDDLTVTLRPTNTEGVLAAVRDGRAGLGFIEGPGDLTGLGGMVVGGDELVLVASPQDPWTRRRRPLTGRDLATRPLSSREPGSGTRRTWELAVGAADRPPVPPGLELESTGALLTAVAAGAAPAFVSRRAVARDLASGHLVELPTPDLDLRRVFTATWSGSRSHLGPGAVHLLDSLQRHNRGL